MKITPRLVLPSWLHFMRGHYNLPNDYALSVQNSKISKPETVAFSILSAASDCNFKWLKWVHGGEVWTNGHHFADDICKYILVKGFVSWPNVYTSVPTRPYVSIGQLKALTWTNDDLVMQHHIAPLGHIGINIYMQMCSLDLATTIFICNRITQ